jgi:cell fate (sporulation/competence/biofilm development) regulator YmcA (YheA/YmcA/DUF963 family)
VRAIHALIKYVLPFVLLKFSEETHAELLEKVSEHMLAEDLNEDIRHVCEQWTQSEGGIGDRDIQEVLTTSVQRALQHILDQYLSNPEWDRLSRNENEAIKTTIVEIKANSSEYFSHLGSQAFGLDHVELVLHGDPEDASAALLERIEAMDWFPAHDYPEFFRRLTSHLLPTVRYFFYDEIVKPGARKARLKFEGFQLERLKHDQQRILATVDSVKKDQKQAVNRLESLCKQIEDGRKGDNPVTEALNGVATRLRGELARFGKQAAVLTQSLRSTERALRVHAEAMTMLQKPLEPDLLAVEEAIVQPSLTWDEFLNLVDQYSDDLPAMRRKSLLADIITGIWGHVVFDPVRAIRLRSKLSHRSGECARLTSIANALIAFSLSTPTEAQLCDLLDSLIDERSGNYEDLRLATFALICRTIRTLLYTRRFALTGTTVQSRISLLARQADGEFDRFFLDIHFRSICHHILVPDSLKESVQVSWTRFLYNHPSSVLSQLYPLLADPLGALHTRSQADLLEALHATAERCADAIECKWCVLTLSRLLPIFVDYDEEQNDHSDAIQHLVGKFNSSIIEASPTLIFFRLNSLLRAFLQKKDLFHLCTFEEEFLYFQSALLIPQIIHMQLEYVACVSVACQFHNSDALLQLQLAQRITTEKRAAGTPLVDNHLIENKHKLQCAKAEDVSLRSYLLSWSSQYTSELFHQYADNLIADQHLWASQFKATSMIYAHRPLFRKAVLESIQDMERHAYPPAYYARSTAVFKFISGKERLDLRSAIIKQALKADAYSIFRNASSIAQTLYQQYYYADSDKAGIHQLVEELIQRTNIWLSGSRPRFFLTYLGGIRYAENDKEQAFVLELATRLQEAGAQTPAISTTRGSESVTIPDNILNTARRHEAESFFAQLIAQSQVNAELWNVLGTCMFDNREKDIPAYLQGAANFYNLAICFARDKHVYDQKYFYNYVRCQAMYHVHTNTPPSTSFVQMVLEYLAKPRASMFAHKDACLAPLFSALKAHWGQFDLTTRTKFRTDLLDVKWLNKKGGNLQLPLS